MRKINKRVPSMMRIKSPTGSHLPTLFQVVEDAHIDGLIVEHGAGLYSTPLLARMERNVVCYEADPGWREWAAWIYEGRCRFLDRFSDLISTVEQAAVVFIDGAATERGPLLTAAIRAGVPAIIVHDTNEGDWHAYGLLGSHFTAPGYQVEHFSADTHRTTLWRR